MSRNPIFKDTSIIVDAAFEMIRDEGFDNFSTRKLANKLDVSKNAVSNYISRKEDIISKVAERFNSIFVNNVLTIIEPVKDYYNKNIFDLYIVFANVLYDMFSEYGDIYKIAARYNSIIFELNLPVEERFKLFFPVFSYIFNNFEYSDYPEFTSPDYLDKHHLLNVLLYSKSIIELNRTNKIGKSEYIRLFRKSFYLITEKSIKD